MHADQKVATLLVLGIAAISWCAAQRMIIAPHARNMQEARRQLQEEQELLQVQTAIARSWPVIQRYQRRLPNASSPDWLMDQVAKLAEAAHVRLTAIEPEPPRALPGATRIGVAVRFDGRYHDIGQFVSLIESAPHYIHVDELEVRAPQAAGAPPPPTSDHRSILTSVRMVLSTLYVPAPQAAR